MLSNYLSVVYDEVNDTYLVSFNSWTVIKNMRVNAGTWFVDKPAIAGPTPAARTNGLQNAMQYVPELRGLVIANKHNGNVFFMRTAA